MPEYAHLDEYAAHRYRPGVARLAAAAKSALPLSLLAHGGPDPAPRPADVLLLQPNAAAAQRHARLREALERRGLRVAEEVVPGVVELLRTRKLRAPAGGWRGIPRRWRLQAAYAAWIVERYRPRLAVTFMDDSFHTPFLRQALARSGGVLANMAHTICFPNMDFSMCDVDWFVVFGRRSLANLAIAPRRFGTCRAVVAGSPYLVDGISGTIASRRTEVPPRLLWVAQYLHPSRRAGLLKDLESLARFAADHPGIPIAVRLHPLDRGQTRAFLERLAPRVRWLDAKEILPRMVGDFDIVASSFSAGLIDAAACGKPVIAFSTSGLAQALGIEEAGLPVVDDAAGLARAIDGIVADYERACIAALKLAGEHYYCIDDATERLAGLFETLTRGGDVSSLELPVHDLD